jgi:DNA-binding transcriptional regulator YbjK
MCSADTLNPGPLVRFHAELEAMTPDEREQMAVLFERIAKEQELPRFTRWVQDLNDLLEKKERRLENRAGKPKLTFSTRSSPVLR